jgi:hypothetical protein
MKNAVFWDVAPCRSCAQTAATCSGWFLARGFFYPEDGGDKTRRTSGTTAISPAPHPRGRYSSYQVLFSPHDGNLNHRTRGVDEHTRLPAYSRYNLASVHFENILLGTSDGAALYPVLAPSDCPNAGHSSRAV